MFNVFHKLFANLILTKPSVHHFQPKSVNVYFKNSVNPKYTLLNLKNYDYVDIEVLQVTQDTTNVFNLVLNLNENGSKEVLSLATFETRREAETAALILRNKLFSVEKTFIRFFAILIIILFAFFLLMSLIPHKQESNLPPFAVSPSGVSISDQQKQIEEMRRQAIASAKQDAAQQIQNLPDVPNAGAQPQAAPQMEVPQDPNVQNFMEKLK